MLLEWLGGPGRQKGCPVFASHAAAHVDGGAAEVEILDAQGHAFGNAQTGAVEHIGDQARCTVHCPQNLADFLHRKHDRQTGYSLYAPEALQVLHREVEHVAVQEQECIERLRLGGRRDLLVRRQIVHERRDAGGAHAPRVAALVKADVLADPESIGDFGSST